MNRRNRQFLTILLCTAFAGNSACSTTTQRLGPTQAAMDHNGVGITGTGAADRAVTVSYGEIFQVERQHRDPVMDIKSPTDVADAVLWGVAYTTIGGAAAAICVEAPLQCLMLAAEMGN